MLVVTGPVRNVPSPLPRKIAIVVGGSVLVITQDRQIDLAIAVHIPGGHSEFLEGRRPRGKRATGFKRAIPLIQKNRDVALDEGIAEGNLLGGHRQIGLAVAVEVGGHDRKWTLRSRRVGYRRLKGPVSVADQYRNTARVGRRLGIATVDHGGIEFAVAIEVRQHHP